MIFGRQPQGHAATLSRTSLKSVRGRTRGVWWLFATLLVLIPFVVLSAGCGGNSSSSPSQSSQTRDARVTGRLVDQYNNSAPVAGATVRYAGISAFTGADGTFSLSVASKQGSSNLTVQSPASINYYSTGYINGQAYDLKNTGFSIGPLQPNQNYSVGDVVLLSDVGPPPPPIF